jgi:hypothetical protein
MHLTFWPRTNDERPTTPNDCNRCNTVPSTFGQAVERGSIRSKYPAEFFDEIVLSNSNTPEMMQEINPKTCRGGRPLVLAHADALSEFSLRSRRRSPGLKKALLASMRAMLKRARLRSKFGPLARRFVSGDQCGSLSFPPPDVNCSGVSPSVETE